MIGDKTWSRRVLLRLSLVLAIPLAVGCVEPRDRHDPGEGVSGDSLPRARSLTDRSFEATPVRLERGRYLAEGILRCIECHSERHPTAPDAPVIASLRGAGRVVSEDADGRRVVAPNLTPDDETGTGAWPDDALARAIREGVGYDGRALGNPMDWESFRNLSDEDLASVIVYLRSLPPVRNRLPPRVLPPERLAELAEDPEPLHDPVPEPDLNDPVARGRYLIWLGNCRGCHTSWYSRPRPGPFGGGNDLKGIFSSNITSDRSGIGDWSERALIQTMRTGRGGTLDPSMPWRSFARMSDADLGAVYRALLETPPVRHWVGNTMPPTFCVVCGQEHGLGELNRPRAAVEPEDIPAAVLADFPGLYVSDEGDTVVIRLAEPGLWVFEDADSIQIVPLDTVRFVPRSGVPSRLQFGRDESGRVTQVAWLWGGIEEDVYRRVR